MEKKKKPDIRFREFSDDWEQRKLGECFTERVESMPDGELISVTINDGIKKFSELGRHDNSNDDKSKYKKVCVGDIAYNSMRMWQGASGYSPYEGIVSPAYTVLSPNSGINSKCLAFQFKLPEMIHTFQINSQGITSDNWNLKYPAFSEIEILVSKSEQEQAQIAEYFSQLDHLITLHQRKLEKLQNIKKSMLEKMFPQNESKIPQIRFKGFTNDWEQRKLSEVATMHARIGWQNLRTSEFLDSGDYLLVTGTDFEDGRINYATCHYVERERYEQDKNIKIENGSILITKDGTLGKVAFVQGLSMPATLNAGVFNVVIKDEKEVDGKYLFQYLKAPFLMDYVDKKATGGTIKHLNQNILVDFPIVMPCVDEQTLIGMYFEQLDNLITLHQRKLEKLQNIKKSMLEKMFI